MKRRKRISVAKALKKQLLAKVKYSQCKPPDERITVLRVSEGWRVSVGDIHRFFRQGRELDMRAFLRSVT